MTSIISDVNKKYNKLRDEGVAKDSLIYLVSSLLSSSIPFILLPFLTRILTIEEYGEVGLFQAMLSILMVFIGIGGVGVARIRFFKSNEFEYYQIVNVILAAFLATLTLGIICAIVFKPWYQNVFEGNGDVLLLVVIAAAGQFLVTLRLAIWQVSRTPLKYGLLQILLMIVNVTLSLFFVMAMSFGSYGRMYGITLSLVLFGVFSLWSVNLSLFRTGEKYSLNACRKVFAFSLPLIPHSMFVSIIAGIDRFALNLAQRPQEVGEYFVALQLSLPIMILTNSINLAFKAWSFEKMLTGNHQDVVRASYIIMLILTVFSSAYLIIVLKFYNIIVGFETNLSSDLVIVLMFCALFSGFQQVVVKGAMFSENTFALSLTTVPVGVFYCLVIFNIALKYGVYGVALSYLIYRILMFFMIWRLSNYLLPQPWFKFHK